MNVFLAIAVDNLDVATHAVLNKEELEPVDRSKVPVEVPTKREDANSLLAHGDIAREIAEPEQFLWDGNPCSADFKSFARECCSSPVGRHLLQVPPLRRTKSASGLVFTGIDCISHLNEKHSFAKGDSQRSDYSEDIPEVELNEEEILVDENIANVPAKVRTIPDYRSLFVFRQENSFRKACFCVSDHFVFRGFILICILISSAILAADDPVRPSRDTTDFVSSYIDESTRLVSCRKKRCCGF